MKFKTQNLLKLAIGALLTLQVSGKALSNDYSDSVQALCDKMKSCAIQEMGSAEGMDEATKAMVMQSLDSMCVGLEQNFSVALIYKDISNAAQACMNSMAQQSCEKLQSDEGQNTPECIEFQEMAKKYE